MWRQFRISCDLNDALWFMILRARLDLPIFYDFLSFESRHLWIGPKDSLDPTYEKHEAQQCSTENCAEKDSRCASGECETAKRQKEDDPNCGYLSHRAAIFDLRQKTECIAQPWVGLVRLPHKANTTRIAYSIFNFPHIPSTLRFTSAGITSIGGHCRVKPSAAHLRVASMPILLPKFGRREAWSSVSTGPRVN